MPERTYGSDVDFDAVLVDGNLVHIRPPAGADRAPLLALHEGLSERSAYFRYFSLSRHAGEAHVDHLLDSPSGELASLIALIGDDVVGLASYERLPIRDEAEVALLVDDVHQGQGVGTLLLEALAVHATSNGVARLVAEVLPNNARMLNVFHSAGFAVHTRYTDGTVHVDLPLARTAVLLDAAGERYGSADRALQSGAESVRGHAPAAGAAGADSTRDRDRVPGVLRGEVQAERAAGRCRRAGAVGAAARTVRGWRSARGSRSIAASRRCSRSWMTQARTCARTRPR